MPSPNLSTQEKLAILEVREDYWQAKLKCKNALGGLNIKSARMK